MTIGDVYTYTGSEFSWMTGRPVRVRAIMPHGADPDSDGAYLYDDRSVAAHKLDPRDRVEVQPYIPHEDRWSFVTSDPLAGDLSR